MKSVLQKTFSYILVFILLFSATLLTACKTSNNINSGNNEEQVRPLPTPEPTEPVQPVEPPVSDNPAPIVPEVPKPAKFVYQATVRQQLPTIHIATSDGSNDFAIEERDYYPVNNYEFVKQEFDYQNCTISVRNAETHYNFENIVAQIKPRGNSTVIYPKKPFRLKFNEKQGMLGLNSGSAAKSWVLLADWNDASLLRNNIGLYLGKLFYESVGLYSSDFCTVELYLNDVYWGVYLLCEQTQVGINRVNITEPARNYTGTDIGYLLELDNYNQFEPELNRFSLDYNDGAEVGLENGTWDIDYRIEKYTIKSDIYSAEQRDFIRNYLENIYRICYKAICEQQYYKFSDDKKSIVLSEDTNARDTIARVVDIDSITAAYIIEEIACNWDIGDSSFYMSVDLGANGDGRLRFQAAWDYDSALGNIEAIDNQKDKIYAANSNNLWLVLFYRADWFRDSIKEMWQEAQSHKIQERLLQYIDACMTNYVDAYARNFDRWKNIGRDISKYYKMTQGVQTQAAKNARIAFSHLLRTVSDAAFNCTTQADAGQYLYTWLQNRFNLLNNLFTK